MPFTIGPAGDSAMRLSFQEAPSPRLTQILLQLQRTAQRYFLESLSDSVVGYATLTLFFTPLSLQRDQVTVWLEKTVISLCDARHVLDTPSTETVVLPVFYDPAVAPDLISVADELGLTIGLEHEEPLQPRRQRAGRRGTAAAAAGGCSCSCVCGARVEVRHKAAEVPLRPERRLRAQTHRQPLLWPRPAAATTPRFPSCKP